MNRAVAFHWALCLAVGTSVAIACGGEATQQPPQVPSATPAGSTAPPATSASAAHSAATAPTAAPTAKAPESAMPALRGSTMSADLQAAGLDPKKLPPLNKLPAAQLRKVMVTFTKALGVPCTKCHTDDFKAPTPMKKVATRMWNEYVVGLQTEDGSALYCDSCHQGKLEYLAKGDKKALSAWMEANFVQKLKRADKKDHGCETCHGEPFDGDFLEKWKK
jgi:hypothetical protein